MSLQERRPWTDGIGVNGLWSKRQRNEKPWEQISKARVELILKAIAWREAALADGWTIEPTYQQHEPMETAFKMHRDGFLVQGLARPPSATMLGTGEIHCWGPDGLAIHAGEIYDFAALQADLRICHNCAKADVDTMRYSFAGRCCAECLPEMRRVHEQPGWCD